MNTESDRDAIRTSPRIVFYAWVIALLVAFCAGCAVMDDILRRVVLRAALKQGIICGVTVGALGASLVGLCGLLSGARIGRNFSYPFTLSLGACGSLVLLSLTRPVMQSNQPTHEGLIWFMGIVLGVVAGAVLAMCVRRYRQWSRVGASIGMAVMLLIGGYLMRVALGGRVVGEEETWIFLIGTLSFVVCGGCLGAVVGAVSDGVYRCWREEGIASAPSGS
ncbi:MAG: hypothetical protein QGG42_07340 [Phycisphaerae bacterium]|jgi:hypothetical protein|nr:hypothetical protein [Phycisphaerae bacterium]